MLHLLVANAEHCRNNQDLSSLIINGVGVFILRLCYSPAFVRRVFRAYLRVLKSGIQLTICEAVWT